MGCIQHYWNFLTKAIVQYLKIVKKWHLYLYVQYSNDKLNQGGTMIPYRLIDHYLFFLNIYYILFYKEQRN